MQVSLYNNFNYPKYTSFGAKLQPKDISSSLKGFQVLSNDVFEHQNTNGIHSLIVELVNKPIKNDAEYEKVIQRVFDEKTAKGTPAWISDKDVQEYADADILERGLIPYCGFDDKSKYINMFLSGRLTPAIKQQLGIKNSSFIDVIRALEYSLKYLDKEFGKFEGLVYRQGFMNEHPNQYISTTTDYITAARLNGSYVNFMPGKQYSVIRTHNGHNIKNFQNKMGAMFAYTEKEVLLPYESRYRKLEEHELDNELIRARENVAYNIFDGSDLVITGVLRKNKGYSKEDLLNMVGVYEEII